MTCKHCGAPLPPPVPGHHGGRARQFCLGRCGIEWFKARKRAETAARVDAPVDRPAFAGSPADIASRAKEIERDPSLQAARQRLRAIRDDAPKTVAQMLSEIENMKRRKR